MRDQDRPVDLYDLARKRRFGRDYSFLCCRRLATEERTKEDVIPKWAMERYKARDMPVRLLNGSAVRTRTMTIPCCQTCNNEWLSRIEGAVSTRVARGLEAVAELPSTTLFVWLGKIFYGVLYRQRLLRRHLDRRMAKTAIVTTQQLRTFHLHQLFLHAAIDKIRFVTEQPWSLLLFQLGIRRDGADQFQVIIAHNEMVIGVRAGSVGMIAALQDGGAIRSIQSRWNAYRSLKLHSAQFAEIVADVIAMTRLATRKPSFVAIRGPNDERLSVAQLPLGGLSAEPLFRPFSVELFASVLSDIIGTPLRYLFQPPDRVRRFLVDESGNPLDVDPDTVFGLEEPE